MSTTVAIDDRFTGIKYAGTWFTSGIPTEYHNTTMITTTNGSTMTFTTTCTSIALWATQGFGDGTNITFTLDGKSDGHYYMPSTTVPNFHNIIYNSSLLENKNHTIVMTVHPTTTNPNLFFDMLTYTFKPSDKQSNGFIFVDDTDPAINYSSNAVELLPTAVGYPFDSFFNTTHYMKKGATAQYLFNGTGVSVYGTVIASSTGPLASFQLDGSNLTNVNVPKLGNGIDTTAILDNGVYGNVLFYTGNHYTAGVVHNLTITSLADEVMYLDYIVVPSLGYSPSTYVAPDTDGPSPQQVSAGAIAGGVIGGLVVLAALIVLLVMYLRKRRKRRDMASSGEINDDGNPDTTEAGFITPFIIDQNITPSRPPPTLNQPSDHSNPPSLSQINSFNTLQASAPSQPIGGIAGTSSINDSDSKYSAQSRASLPPVTQVIHQDSGLRLGRSGQPEHVPPSYTQD